MNWGERVSSRQWIRSDFSSIVGVGILFQVLTVVSGPLVARMLGPDGRGAVTMVMVVATLCGQLAVSSLSRGISHAVAQAHAPARDVLGSNLRLWFCWPVVPAALAIAATAVIRPGDQLVPLTAIEAGVITLFGCWLALIAGMQQGEGNVRQINVNRILFAATYVAAVAVVWFVHRTDLAVVILGTYILAQVVVLRSSWRGLQTPTGDLAVRAPRADIHRFARRTLIVSVSFVDGFVDQLVLGFLVTSATLGLYAVASSVTTLPGMVLGGVTATLLPRMAARGPVEAAATMRQWVRGALVVNLVLVLGMEAIIAPALRIFFGEAFVPAIGCARILIIARAILALRLVLSAAAQAQGRGGRTSTIELIATGVVLVSVPIGVHLHGIEGAAVGLVLAGVAACGLLAGSISWSGSRIGQETRPESRVTVVEPPPARSRRSSLARSLRGGPL